MNKISVATSMKATSGRVFWQQVTSVARRNATYKLYTMAAKRMLLRMIKSCIGTDGVVHDVDDAVDTMLPQTPPAVPTPRQVVVKIYPVRPPYILAPAT